MVLLQTQVRLRTRACAQDEVRQDGFLTEKRPLASVLIRNSWPSESEPTVT